MSKVIYTDARIYIGGYDFSGDMNAFALAHAADTKDVTNFASNGWREFLGGLVATQFAIEGFVNPGLNGVDDIMFGKVGVIDTPLMSVPENAGADGDPGFFGKIANGEYKPGGSVGDEFKYSVSGQFSTGGLVRGTVMHNNTRTANGNGTARQLGALSASQSMEAQLHVLSASAGDTLDVIIQSDSLVGMTSPTPQITFSQATAVGAQHGSVSGAVTDDWWRANYTIAGTGPSFLFALIMGIK